MVWSEIKSRGILIRQLSFHNDNLGSQCFYKPKWAMDVYVVKILVTNLNRLTNQEWVDVVDCSTHAIYAVQHSFADSGTSSPFQWGITSITPFVPWRWRWQFLGKPYEQNHSSMLLATASTQERYAILLKPGVGELSGGWTHQYPKCCPDGTANR